MQRKKRLGADPEKVRAFLARGRGSLKTRPKEPAAKGRATLKRKVELARGSLKDPSKRSPAKRKVAPTEGPLTPAEWRRQVFELSGRRCIVSGSPSNDPYDPDFHAHHALGAQQLRKRGLHAYVWDARNGVLVSEIVHMEHEHHAPTIFAEHLPARVWEFAAEMDALVGTEWATAKVERQHPPAGKSRVTNPRRQH